MEGPSVEAQEPKPPGSHRSQVGFNLLQQKRMHTRGVMEHLKKRVEEAYNKKKKK